MGLDFNEATLCSCGCGFPTAVSQAPENEGRFTVEPPSRCHARTAMVLAMKRYEDDSVSVPEALLWERPTLRPAAQ